MTIQEKKSEGYLTLKEASDLYGYSPDYIGQLIRKGKINGKQVYANVAWVTTKEEIENYLAKERKTETHRERTGYDRVMQVLVSSRAASYAELLLAILIPILVVSLLIVFYFLSISLDHHLAREAERRLSEQSITIPAPTRSASISQLTYEKRP